MIKLTSVIDMETIINCPDCKTELEIYGVFASGLLKYCCNKCYRILSESESLKYKTDRLDKILRKFDPFITS